MANAQTLRRDPGRAALLIDSHVSMVCRETLIGVAGNGLIAAGVVAWLFRGQQQIPVLGRDGAVFGIVPGTFMFTLGMTIGLTLTVRSRLRAGKLSRLEQPLKQSCVERLPSNVFLRATMLALAVEICVVPLTLLFVALVAPPQWGVTAAIGFNILYFVLLSGTVVPIVAWRALRDH